MRSRLVVFRQALVRPRTSSLAQSSTLRTFTQNTSVRLPSRARPQLPFLSVPTASRPRVRYLTTQRKAWLRYEFTLGIKYIIYVAIGGAACLGFGFVFHQEMLERYYPTPHEWSFLTRVRFRVAQSQREFDSQGGITDWVAVIQHLQTLVNRLQDPKGDGSLVTQKPNGLGRDISAKPEPWRRGYFEAMMAYAKAAEYVDGWLLDKKRGIVFPPDVITGPANPFPLPIPAGSVSPPKLEDCEQAFSSPKEIYQQILDTEGFTPRQVMDASLAYAAWLDYSHDTALARSTFEDAVHVASAGRQLFDPATFVLNDKGGPPSANVLKALTEYATFRARAGEIDAALPIFISVLKARRNLPHTARKSAETPAVNPLEDPLSKLWRVLKAMAAPPSYPPPPEDGQSPPYDEPQERCEEAALHLYIGEIMYASQNANREDGLAWTRDAVDLAEEQLHKLKASKKQGTAGKNTCKECLETGLGNWTAMVERLAREEAVKHHKQTEKPAGWFDMWRGTKAENLGRWAAEGAVILERQRRAKELLEDLDPPQKGFASIFKV